MSILRKFMVGNMKFDKVKIGKIISDVGKYSKDLEEVKIVGEEDLKRKDKFYICSMLVFSIVNGVVDLGNEIISAKKLEMPHSYKEIFEILSNRKLITEKTRDELIELVRIRNAIAHRYFTVTPSKLFHSLEKLASVKGFVERVKKLVK